jgi:hypothetical protein
MIKHDLPNFRPTAFLRPIIYQREACPPESVCVDVNLVLIVTKETNGYAVWFSQHVAGEIKTPIYASLIKFFPAFDPDTENAPYYSSAAIDYARDIADQIEPSIEFRRGLIRNLDFSWVKQP